MPDDRPTSEVRRFSFATDDIDQAHEILRQLYVDHEVRLHRPAQGFEYRQDAVDAGPMVLGRVRYKMDVDLRLEPLDRLLFVVVSGGVAESQAGREAFRGTPGDVFLNPTGVPLTNVCRQIDVHTLSLDPALVAETAATQAGIGPGDLRFESMAPVSAEMGRYFRDTVSHLRRLLTGPDQPLRHALVMRAALDLIATSALATFPNTAMAASYRPEPGPVASAAVRRAVSFIETHAGEPITAERIAQAARISARALQTGFRRHLDTTPMAYLRRVRLDRAHRDLQIADPSRGDTVANIARRWGYAGMSKFSADYRAAFGRPPSHTLRA
ncbi:MAG: AraC family transcriptional regulator [Actinoplanes sp.]